MLVLGRKVGEKILIGDDVVITLVRVGEGGARIGIEAPRGVEIIRAENAEMEEGGGRLAQLVRLARRQH